MNGINMVYINPRNAERMHNGPETFLNSIIKTWLNKELLQETASIQTIIINLCINVFFLLTLFYTAGAMVPTLDGNAELVAHL